MGIEPTSVYLEASECIRFLVAPLGTLWNTKEATFSTASRCASPRTCAQIPSVSRGSLLDPEETRLRAFVCNR